MMVLRRSRLLTVCLTLVVAVTALGVGVLYQRGELDYMLTWDPRPATRTQPDGAEVPPGTADPLPGLSVDPAAVTEPRTADFFLDFKLDRERTRGQQLEQLRELINNSKVEESARRQAAEDWLALTRQVGKELELEGLIKAKGWPDCVVFLQAENCTVVVKADALAKAEVAQIGDIVVRGTGLAPQAIAISARPK